MNEREYILPSPLCTRPLQHRRRNPECGGGGGLAGKLHSLGSESWRSDTLPVEIKGEHIHAPLILCPYNRHTFLGLSKEILFQDSASSSSPGTRSVRIPSSALSFLADFSQFFFSRCSCEYLSLTFLCSVKRHLLLHLDLVGNTRAVVYPRGNS